MAAAVPLGRAAHPADVANAVLFLASNQSSFTTGSEPFVDGGVKCPAASANWSSTVRTTRTNPRDTVAGRVLAPSVRERAGCLPGRRAGRRPPMRGSRAACAGPQCGVR